MTKKESKKLKCGIYTIHWKEGGTSLASIGVQKNGNRWFAPVNWASPCTNQLYWKTMSKVVLMRTY